MAAGGYTDAALNLGGAGSDNVTIDTTNPTLSVDIADGSLNDCDTSSVVKFTFCEAPVGFTAADIDAVGGVVTGLSATGDPLVYTATFTADDGFSGTGSVTVAAGGYTDAALNLGGAGSDSVTVDTANPTVAITDDEPGTANIAGGDVVYTFQFSETVTDFTSADVTVAGGTKGTFTAVDGDTYTLVVTPTASFEGDLTVDVAASAAVDGVGNSSTAAPQSVQAVDTAVPTVAITDDEPGTANIAGGDVVYTFQFSETVTDFTSADVTVAGGTKGTFTAVDGDTYTLEVTPTAGLRAT